MQSITSFTAIAVTLFAKGNLVLCPLKRNDVCVFHRKTMLCPCGHKHKKRHDFHRVFLFGAGGRTRTGTLSPAVDFESTTSANSITPACDLIDNTIRCNKNQVKILAFIKSFYCFINHINVVLRYNLKRCVHRKHGNADINYIHAEVCKIHSNRSAAA